MPHQKIAKMFESHPWTVAKTMPENPHEYTLRKDWEEDDFNWAEKYLTAYSEPFEFGGRIYKVFVLDGYRYWTMVGYNGTTLINRAVHE